MMAIDHSQLHALSVRGLEDDFVRREAGTAEDVELHLLRLVLDLQVDALLLTLGASVRPGSAQVPWQRWLAEDLELAQVLTAALTESESAPWPTIGGAVSGPTGNVLDHLLSRYTTMRDQLDHVLRRAHTGQTWRMAATHAQVRCRSRIDELHLHRRAAHARAAAERAATGEAPSGQTPKRESYLPGELLG